MISIMDVEGIFPLTNYSRKTIKAHFGSSVPHPYSMFHAAVVLAVTFHICTRSGKRPLH